MSNIANTEKRLVRKLAEFEVKLQKPYPKFSQKNQRQLDKLIVAEPDKVIDALQAGYTLRRTNFLLDSWLTIWDDNCLVYF